MTDLHDLELMLRSRTPILLVETLEETRLLQLLTQLAMRLDQPLYQWTVTDGLRRADIEMQHIASTQEPADALLHIRAQSNPALYSLLDFHPFLGEPLLVRLLKEIAQREQPASTLILISHAVDCPPELAHLVARFSLSLPDRATLKRLIRDEARNWQQRHPGTRIKADREALEKLADNLLGVTRSDARRLIHNAIADDGAITHDDLPQVMRAKYQLLGNDGAIGFEYETANFRQIAGLDRLKNWLQQRESAFRDSDNELDPPKGLLLLGVQGCGKSLAAKAVAGQYELPLLRLDFGALYNKWIGETEKNLQQALKTAEVMAPCVLWIDEIEKGLSSSDIDADGGVSKRLLGSLLTWMAEHDGRVFIVATANDVQRLPPELLRKGRLDEIFFVDLPNHDTRQAIFYIHLEKRGLRTADFDLPLLAGASEGFSGAEIEQAVVAALYSARAAGGKPDHATLLNAIEQTSPLSVVMAEQIDQLRDWATNRTVPAH